MNFKISKITWTNEEIIREIDYFEKLYSERPIKNNHGGMMFPHMFAFYFLLKKLNPNFVIESGVFKGQGTWLIENTLPDAEILSLDIKLSDREYISKKAKYSNLDFKFHDFTKIDSNKTLAFFDDHQNALERVKECKWAGIKHIIFEDNYPPNKGDFYSLKQIYAGSGFKLKKNVFFERLKGIIIFLNFQIKSMFSNNYPFVDFHRFRANHVKPNLKDQNYLNKHLEVYYEFPPIYLPNKYFNEEIDKKAFIKTLPLLSSEKEGLYKSAFDEKNYYNWITYLKLS